MGTQSIVHARITLKDNFSRARDFIESLGNDETFPFMRSDMFNIGPTERPYYYYHPVVIFGATYKAVEYDWKAFIIKFEHILRNLEFGTAKVQLETAFLGTYNFFWKKKDGKDKMREDESLIETDEWFFGYGNRSCWGTLDEVLSERKIFTFQNFQYPIKFDEEMKFQFNSLIEKITAEGITSGICLDDYLKPTLKLKERESREDLYPILVHLKVHDFIDFKFESGRGLLINLKKQLEKF